MSNPTTPRVKASQCTTWWDYANLGTVSYLATDGRFLYYTDDWHGLSIVDVSLTNVIARQTQLVSVRDVALVGESPVFSDRISSLHLIDMSDPKRPRQVGVYQNDGINHRRYPHSPLVTEGQYAYVFGGGFGMSIVDFSNPRTPREVGSYWVREEAFLDYVVVKKRAYLVLGGTGLDIVDVSNPSAPRKSRRDHGP